MFFLEILAGMYDSMLLLISHIAGRSSFPKPLKADEERRAVEGMLAGNTEDFKLLVEHNLRLVAHIAKKYMNSGVEQDDLVSIGSIGLIKAVTTFRPEAGRLTAYASRSVENEILMTLRSNKKNKQNLSLSDPIGSDREGNEIMLLDILGTEVNLVPDQAETNIESARAIRLLGKVLTDRERRVVMLRCGLLDGVIHPQHEVAAALGISRSYVSRIEKKAFQKLKDALENGAHT
ncbi:RNA polymerase sporulation sigma factor SigK [Eubacteriales bacterium OttesenSCG-928-N13]|nr:RNA polymerase sporulation sigma factor SigK [Eubacteriales bacterium OttesenSCG-928-N13]